MTRDDDTKRGVERALAVLDRYALRGTPPHYLPPPEPALDALIRALEQLK